MGDGLGTILHMGDGAIYMREWLIVLLMAAAFCVGVFFRHLVP